MRLDAPGARRRSVLCLRSALFLSVAVLWCTLPAAAQQTGYEEGIMELVADRLPPTTIIVLVDSAGSVLLPVQTVTSFLGYDRAAAGHHIAIPQIGGNAARIDTAAFTLVLPTRTVQLAPAEMPRRGDVVFLRVEHLQTLLDADVHVDLASLTVVFARAVPFPAQQRVVAEQRRAAVLARQRWLEERAVRDSVTYNPLTGGVIADWEIASSSLDPGQLTTLRARAGLAVLGGDLSGGGALELGRSVDDDLRDLTLQYHRVFPHSRYVTQLRAGDMLTSGLFSRHVRGVELGNRPFLRSTELSSILLRPDLPPGWEYEVFQGNQLLGYSLTGSTDAVAVPLRAGATPLQVRMLGPAGEEVVQTLLYQTPVSMLQRGIVEYTVGGGDCSVGCDEFAHGDVRYGFTPLITAGAGTELVRDSAGTAFRPYLVYSMSTGTHATAELTVMPSSLYSANLAFFPRAGSAAYLRANLARGGFGPISVIRDDNRRWDVEANWDQRITRTLPISQLRIGVAGAGSQSSLRRLRISSTGAFRTGYAELRYDRDRTSSQPDLVTTRAAVFVPFNVRGRSLRPLLTAGVGTAAAGVRLVELSVSLQPRPASVINAAAQWLRGTAQPTLTLGYSVRTGPVLAGLRAVSSPGGASSAAMLSGSAALSPHGDIALHASARTGYAGVSGTVFIDEDGDGVLSAGDTRVPEAFLVVDGRRVAADSTGRFRAWGLQPYQPVDVAIDSTRTPDPGLTTVRSETVVRPVPNMARHIVVPLVRTRELLGSVIANDDAPTANLTLEVLDLDSGEITSTVTFSDGFFYVSRLRPGRYRVTISSSSLEAIGAAAITGALDFIIPASGDDIAVELPPLRLRRR